MLTAGVTSLLKPLTEITSDYTAIAVLTSVTTGSLVIRGNSCTKLHALWRIESA